MKKRLCAIRGACFCENTPESIQKNVADMCRQLFSKNHLKTQDLVSIHFTMTRSLDCLNAASALRKSDVGLDVSRVPLFVSQEALTKGSPDKAIRVLVTAYMKKHRVAKSVYINGAESLRADLFASKATGEE